MHEQLDQWDFVIAAYVVGMVATLALSGWAWWDMRRAERRREEARRK